MRRSCGLAEETRNALRGLCHRAEATRSSPWRSASRDYSGVTGVTIPELCSPTRSLSPPPSSSPPSSGFGSLGLKDVAMREVHEPAVAQTVIAQIGQGLGIMCFLFHTLIILQFFAYKITKKGVKNDSAKPENRSPSRQ